MSGFHHFIDLILQGSQIGSFLLKYHVWSAGRGKMRAQNLAVFSSGLWRPFSIDPLATVPKPVFYQESYENKDARYTYLYLLLLLRKLLE
jgi:hypothetical protein